MGWKFGVDISDCILVGKYVHIVADYSEYAITGYVISLCSVGFMGQPSVSRVNQRTGKEVGMEFIVDVDAYLNKVPGRKEMTKE